MKTYLIVGGSRGVGQEVARAFSNRSDIELFTVSRTKSHFGTWIESDVSRSDDIFKIAKQFQNKRLDALLYLGGTWEKDAFTKNYDFENSHFDEIDNVIGVNLIAPLKITKTLLPSLKLSQNPKVIFMGALSGLSNRGTKEVANTASKYGLQGMSESMAIGLSKYAIGFSVINPGNIATEEVLNDIKTNQFRQQIPIPISDLISTIDLCLSLSRNSYPEQINLAQTYNSIE
jgi:3-oxoacyl-[acyl-carrier protein] reductase